MSRLQTSLDTLATRGVERGADEIFEAATAPASALFPRPDRTGGPRSWAVFAGALVLVLGIGLGIGLLVGSPGPDLSQPSPTLTTPVPSITLPPADEIPLTVPSELGPSWYTFLPDVHLAWLAREDGSTDLCWRTPTDEGCVDDQFWAPDVLLVPSGTQVIAITRPALAAPKPEQVVFELSTSQSITVPLADREGVALMYARLEPPEEAAVVSGFAHGGETSCAEPPGSRQVGTSPTFALTVTPKIVAPGDVAEISLETPPDVPQGSKTFVGLVSSWQCWDGSAWVETSLLAKGPVGSGQQPLVQAVDSNGSGVGFYTPLRATIHIPDVPPGTYRIVEVVHQEGSTLWGPFEAFAVIEVR